MHHAWMRAGEFKEQVLGNMLDKLTAITIVALALFGIPGLASAEAAAGNAELRSSVVLQSGHDGTVNALAVSSDGAYVVSGSADTTMMLRDVSSNRLLRTFGGHSGAVLSVAFSPDGASIASASKDQTARIWDAASGGLLGELVGHAGPVRSVAVSPDGRFVVTGSGDKTLRLWEVASGQTSRVFEGHNASVTSVAFSPDGAYVVSGSADKTVSLWDVASGRRLRLFKGHTALVTSVDFSPSGNRIASGSWDKSVRIWDVATGDLISTLEGHTKTVAAVSFSANGQQVVSGGGDKNLIVWELATSRASILEGHSGSILAIAVSVQGVVMSSGVDKRISFWSLQRLERLRERQRAAVSVNSAVFSPDGRRIITGSDDGTVRGWDAASGQQLFAVEDPSSDEAHGVLSVAVSFDGTRILSGSTDGIARLWDAATGRLVRAYRRQDGPVDSVAFSPDGAQILLSDRYIPRNDKRINIRLLATTSGRADNRLEIRPDLFGPLETISVAYSPRGDRIAASVRVWVQLWDAESGKRVAGTALHDNRHTGPVSTLAFSPDGSLLASGGDDHTIRLWTSEGRFLRVFRGHTDAVISVAFSPNGTRIVSASEDNSLKIWNTRGALSVTTFTGHSAAVMSASYSPDGQRIVSASADGMVKIWDAGSGQNLASFVVGENHTWLSMTPDGFFTGSGTETAARNLSIVRGLEAFSIGQFYQTLARADLVHEALSGDPDGRVRQAARELNLDAIIGSGGPPGIEIISPDPERKAENQSIDVHINVVDRDGGIGRIEWKVNGTTIGIGERGLSRIENAEPGTDRILDLTRNVMLEPGDNVIEIIAYNAANQIASEPVSVTVTWVGFAGTESPDLHIMAIGVNDYWDSQLRLNYAVPDARAVAAAFRQAGPGLYEEVHVHTLYNEQVTVDGLERAFAELSGKVNPQDVFVFFIAGHGKTVDGRYYFLPQDFHYRNAESIVADGIGQDLWQAWFARIQARRSVLLYDTCESGSLTGDRIAERGLGRVTAIDKLTRAMGRTVLSASTDDAPALEGYRGHGVFTYALLEAMNGADVNGNEQIEVTELAAYVDDRVPAISHETFGFRQVPQMRIVGSNFAVGSRVAALGDASGAVSTIPNEPTHILPAATAVLAEASSDASEIVTLDAWTVVRVLEADANFALIARDGARLGYVPASALRRIQ